MNVKLGCLLTDAQEATGFSQRIENKCLLLAAFSDDFVKHSTLKRFNYYHFALGDDEDENENEDKRC